MSLPEGQKEISGDMGKLILCEYSGDLMKDDDKRRVKERQKGEEALWMLGWTKGRK